MNYILQILIYLVSYLFLGLLGLTLLIIVWECLVDELNKKGEKNNEQN